MGLATIILAIALVLVLILAFTNKSPTNWKGTTTNQGNNQQKVQVSLDGAYVKGNENAPIVIVEFSDFQCPFCARFFSQTLPLIEENYIKTGKVKFAYRHFPLSFHQYAEKAAIASECAGEQGKFWEYHDLLFEKQSEWSRIGVEKFKEYASELGLDTAKLTNVLIPKNTKAKYKKTLMMDLVMELEEHQLSLSMALKLLEHNHIVFSNKLLNKS